MDANIAIAALKFLSRVQLTGNEVQAFLVVQNTLNSYVTSPAPTAPNLELASDSIDTSESVAPPQDING